jgi:hypothetical protein
MAVYFFTKNSPIRLLTSIVPFMHWEICKNEHFGFINNELCISGWEFSSLKFVGSLPEKTSWAFSMDFKGCTLFHLSWLSLSRSLSGLVCCIIVIMVVL